MTNIIELCDLTQSARQIATIDRLKKTPIAQRDPLYILLIDLEKTFDMVDR